MRGRDFQLCGFCFLFTYLWADSSIRLVYFSLLRCTFWVILHSFQSSDNLDASESNANVIKWDKHHESKDIIMDLRLRNIYICLNTFYQDDMYLHHTRLNSLLGEIEVRVQFCRTNIFVSKKIGIKSFYTLSLQLLQYYHYLKFLWSFMRVG